MLKLVDENHFRPLFLSAYRVIDSVDFFAAPPMEWTLGGGTALAMYFQHRKSNDLDIFITDVQYLGFLTPRKNPEAEKETDQYDEQANFVKLYFGDYEIDFIVAPSLTGKPPTPFQAFGREIFIESPAEILVKKIFYRSASLKGRDLFDIARVLQAMPELGEELKEFACVRKDVLDARLSMSSTQLSVEYGHFVAEYGGPSFRDAVSMLKGLYSKAKLLGAK